MNASAPKCAERARLEVNLALAYDYLDGLYTSGLTEKDEQVQKAADEYSELVREYEEHIAGCDICNPA